MGWWWGGGDGGGWGVGVGMGYGVWECGIWLGNGTGMVWCQANAVASGTELDIEGAIRAGCLKASPVLEGVVIACVAKALSGGREAETGEPLDLNLRGPSFVIGRLKYDRVRAHWAQLRQGDGSTAHGLHTPPSPSIPSHLPSGPFPPSPYR